jgi:cytochrome bd-type quinol oxidase subunit 2
VNAFKSLSAVTPGLATLFVARYLNLFVITRIAYPNWQDDAEKISLATGVFVASAICLIYRDRSKKDLRKLAKQLLWSTILGLAVCLVCWFILGRAFANSLAQPIQDFWFISFVTTMTLMVATIAVGALSIKEQDRSKFWLIVIAALVLIIIGLALLFFF